MSGLAEILLLSTPLEISGCDRERSENTDRLTKLGAKIAYGHDPKHVLETDLLVTSAAVPDSSPEVEAARQRMAAQMPLDTKRALADHVIDNSGATEQTRAQAEQLWALLVSSD